MSDGITEIIYSVLDPKVVPDVPLNQSGTTPGEDFEVWMYSPHGDETYGPESGWHKVVTLSEEGAWDYADQMNARRVNVEKKRVHKVYKVTTHVRIHREEMDRG